MKRLLILAISCFLLAAQAQDTQVITARRRGPSFTPPNIANLAFWYSADCITLTGSVCSFPSNGTSVTAWADQSGNAFNLTRNGGTCTLNTSQINGKPAVSMTSNCSYAMANSGPTGASGVRTVFVVFANTSNASRGDIISGPALTFEFTTNEGGKEQGIVTSTTTVRGTGTASADLNWHQVNGQTQNASSGGWLINFRIDRATDTTLSSSSTNFSAGNTNTIGCNQTNLSAECVTAKIAEIIYYTAFLTPTQIGQVEGYLNAKYGL